MADLTERLTPTQSKEEEKPMPLMDKIINDRGYSSPQQWRIILFTTLAISLEGMHFNILGMILIPMKNLYKLSDSSIQFISGIMYISVAVGSFLSGHLIKKYPKIFIINNTVLATFILHLLMGIIPNIVIFTIIRIMLGFCLGVFIPLITNLLCEYCPINRRSFVFNATWVGYNIGCLFFACSQLMLMPNLEEEHVQRTLIFTSILPLGVYIALKLFLKDSPRNLILMGKEDEAFVLIEKFKCMFIEEGDRERIIRDIKGGVNKEIEGHFKDLFKKKYRKMTIILMFLWFSVYQLYYGPFLILSWVIKAIGEETVVNHTNNDIIRDEIKIYCIGATGYFLGGIISELRIFGRKKGIMFGLTFCIFFTLCGINFPKYFVTFFGIYFIFLNIPLVVVDIYSCELYPTKIRDVAVGFLFACCRIGSCISNFIFVDFFSLGTFVPFYAVIIICIFDIALTSFIPFETFGAALDTEFKSKNQLAREKLNLIPRVDFPGKGERYFNM